MKTFSWKSKMKPVVKYGWYLLGYIAQGAHLCTKMLILCYGNHVNHKICKMAIRRQDTAIYIYIYMVTVSRGSRGNMTICVYVCIGTSFLFVLHVCMYVGRQVCMYVSMNVAQTDRLCGYVDIQNSESRSSFQNFELISKF